MREFIALACLLISGSVYADGVYDGIWQSEAGTYTTVNQNGSTIIMVGLNPASLTFGAAQGILQGNEVVTVTVLGNGQVTSKTVFFSPTSAESTLLSCKPAPGFECVAPEGAKMMIYKIF